MERPIVIRSQPGIKRDGTQFEGDNYIEGLWCRFQRGLPRKIGGFQGVASTVPELARGMSSFSSDGTQYLHMGGATTLTQVRVNSQGQFIGQSARTPGALVNSVNNLWQFDVFNNSVSATDNNLIAHAGQNLNDISSDVETAIFAGDITGTGALTDTGMDPQSGGVVVLAPYLITYGNGGRVDSSAPNDFSATDGTAFVTGQKIVKGLPLRGGGTGPSGLLWSLDSLVRMTFNSAIVSGVPFSFDTISSETSILSAQSVIEYDGVYFWCGVDRFLMFNGVVREVPNSMNLNWFYDNLNYTYAQKVFAFKVPRYGEIWWCYPRGNATECTHAVIYNVRENTWYDTQLPAGGRTTGVYAKVYSKPFMVDLVQSGTGYTVWQHETGVDSINGTQLLPVRSFFRTSDITLLTQDQAQDKSLRCARVEPDFVQSGDLMMRVSGRANARADNIDGDLYTFPAVSTGPENQIVNLKEIRRLMTFYFESNTFGGDYQMGQCIAHVEPADGRVTR